MFARIDGSDALDVDDLEALGRWLLERAAECRQAIATEDGAR